MIGCSLPYNDVVIKYLVENIFISVRCSIYFEFVSNVYNNNTVLFEK